jgi:hypothetical protein
MKLPQQSFKPKEELEIRWYNRCSNLRYTIGGGGGTNSLTWKFKEARGEALAGDEARHMA